VSGRGGLTCSMQVWGRLNALATQPIPCMGHPHNPTLGAKMPIISTIH